MTNDLGNKESTDIDLRNTLRCELASRDPLRVDVRIDEQLEPLSGQVIDLSRGGAKIMLPTTVAINSEASIEIKTGSGTITSKVKVCWSRPSENAWCIGVAFKDEFPASELSILATNGYIERRRDKRVAHRAGMTARWELGADPICVNLVDVSAGGLRITSSEAGEVGHRVLIETDDNPGLPIVVKIQWLRATEQGFDIGCAFVNKNCYRTLRQQLGIHRRIPLPPLPSYTTRQLIALTVGIAIVTFAGFMIANNDAAEAIGLLFRNAYR